MGWLMDMTDKPDTNIVNTVPKLFWYNVENYGDDITMWRKNKGIWESHTWNDYGSWARDLGPVSYTHLTLPTIYSV